MPARVVCFGEVLLRLNCSGNNRFLQSSVFEAGYVGSETNVAVLLSRLNTSTTVVTSLPDNDLGSAAVNEMRRYGIDTSHVQLNEGRIGVFFTESGASIRPGNIIYDRGDSCFAKLRPGMIPWSDIFKGATWYHWSGISPSVSASAAAVCLEAVKAAKQAGLKISADFNYRSKLWKYGKHASEVMPELLSYCDVVYGDIDTAEIYFDIKANKSLSRDEALVECGAQLRTKMPNAKTIVMTFREQVSSGSQRYSGVLLNEQLYQSQAFELGNIVERIGTGDAFMGGLIFALSQNYDSKKAIDFAVAAGALKHTVTGDAAIINPQEIESLIKSGSTFGRIIR
jgi:2-dehydro-3-deoxygluconokinase